MKKSFLFADTGQSKKWVLHKTLDLEELLRNFLPSDEKLWETEEPKGANDFIQNVCLYIVKCTGNQYFIGLCKKDETDSWPLSIKGILKFKTKENKQENTKVFTPGNEEIYLNPYDKLNPFFTSKECNDECSIYYLYYNLIIYKNTILEGPPGTGKTYTATELAKCLGAEIKTITMHPSTSYEDFIEGIRPIKQTKEHTIEQSESKSDPEIKELQFGVRDGFFKLIVEKALNQPDEKYVVLLDEINRTNVPKVLGDLLTTIERSKRVTYHETETEKEWTNKNIITLPYSQEEFFVPDNIYIIGTMNTADHSVAPLDSALRRRFAFIRLEPMKKDNLIKELEQILGEDITPEEKDKLMNAIEQWDSLNNILQQCLGPDAVLGHSYFYDACKSLVDTKDQDLPIIQWMWQHELLPQLIELLNGHGADDLIINEGELSKTWLEEHDFQSKKIEEIIKLLTALHKYLLDEFGLKIGLEGTGLGRALHIKEIKEGEQNQSDDAATTPDQDSSEEETDQTNVIESVE